MICQREGEYEFHVYLDQLMRVLDLKNQDVALLAGLDRSLLSYYRNGNRSPYADSDNLKALAQGICLAAQRAQRLPGLADFMRTHPWARTSETISAKNREELARQLTRSFSAILNTSVFKRKQDFQSYKLNFSQRLDQLMFACKINNSMLARTLFTDNSLVSRWRNGLRVPAADSPVLKKMARVFSQKLCLAWCDAEEEADCEAADILQQLTHFAKAEKLDFPVGFAEEPAAGVECAAALTDLLWRWLSSEDQQGHTISRMNQLFEHVAFWDQTSEQLRHIQTYLNKFPVHAKKRKYNGIEGFREAVIRFLSEGLLHSKKQCFKLYSNQNMAWMMGDQQFLVLLFSLLKTLLQKGHEIEIIHNFDRPEVELLVAFEHWMPLYLEGALTSYTMQQTGPEGAYPFVKTIFMNVGVAAITSDFVFGAEEMAVYHFSTSKTVLEDQLFQFEQLKQHAQPLATSLASGLEHTYFWPVAGTWHVQEINPSIPAGLIPEEIWTRLLRENHVSAKNMALLQEMAGKERDWFETCLRESSYQLLLPALPAGQDKYFTLSFTLDEKENPVLKWPKGLYEKVLARLFELEQTGNFSFRQLSSLPYDELRIIYWQGHTLRIIKKSPPRKILDIENVLIREQFERYFAYLEENV